MRASSSRVPVLGLMLTAVTVMRMPEGLWSVMRPGFGASNRTVEPEGIVQRTKFQSWGVDVIDESGEPRTS